MFRNGEVIICPDCPRKSLIESVKIRSWSLQESTENNAKICAKIRTYKDTDLPRCRKYPEDEILDPWLKGCKNKCKTKKTKTEPKLSLREIRSRKLLLKIASRSNH